MRLSHLSRRNATKPRGLQRPLQLQEELFRLFRRMDAESWHLFYCDQSDIAVGQIYGNIYAFTGLTLC